MPFFIGKRDWWSSDNKLQLVELKLSFFFFFLVSQSFITSTFLFAILKTCASLIVDDFFAILSSVLPQP